MLKRSLSGKDHGNRWIRLVASLNAFVIAHGASGLDDAGDSLAYADVHAVAEREKGI